MYTPCAYGGIVPLLDSDKWMHVTAGLIRTGTGVERRAQPGGLVTWCLRRRGKMSLPVPD